MATRRLVQRSRQTEDSSPVSRSRQQSSTAGRQCAAQPQTRLPPYEPPSCPLNADARRQLSNLNLDYDYAKYTLSLKACRTALITTTADVFERAKLKNEYAERETNRRRKAGGDEERKTNEEIEAVKGAEDLEAQAMELRAMAEKAVRDVIDLEDELAMNDTMMKDVITNIPPPPEPRPMKAPRARNPDNEDEEGEDREQEEVVYMVPDVAGVSTMNLLKARKQEYLDTYKSKGMRQRYENTEYATFIRTVHSSQHGDDVPVPHARTWFKEDGTAAKATSSRRRTAVSDDDSDDDIVVSRASANLKCLFTLQYFVEPYSSNACKHTFEKAAFLDYFKKEAKHHDQRRDARGRGIGPAGPLKVECPQSGCQKLLHPDDFYEDMLIARQVKRAKQAETRGEDEEDDEEDDDSAPKGTQRSRPAQVDSDNDVEIEEDEHDRKRQALRIKQERAQSRGVSMAPSQAVPERMDLDDEEEDDEDDEDEDE